MNTDGGWITVSEAARLYGKSRKWVYDQIKRYQIGTEKTANRTRLRLVDLIAHRGEPQKGAPGNNGTPTVKGQIITPEIAPETEILKQENGFLRRRIEELEADREERKQREERLQRILERQTMALPKAEGRGVFSRLLGWLAVR